MRVAGSGYADRLAPHFDPADDGARRHLKNGHSNLRDIVRSVNPLRRWRLGTNRD